MNDSNASKAETSPAVLVEDDSRETVMDYGQPASPLVYVAVGVAWAGLLVGVVSYLAMFYFPDLALWRAW